MNHDRSCQEYTLSAQKTDLLVEQHKGDYPRISHKTNAFLRTNMLAQCCHTGYWHFLKRNGTGRWYKRDK